MKKLFLICLAFSFLFFSCSDLLQTPEPKVEVEGEVRVDSSSGYSSDYSSASSSSQVLLTVSVDDASSSRTALPVLDKSKFNYISLMYMKDDSYTMVGHWDSVDELQNAVLPFMVGTYDFSLSAVYNDMIFREDKEYTIKNGNNALSFNPKLVFLSTDTYGKGGVEVKVSYNTTDVAKVEAGLYRTDGTPVSGFNAEELTSEAGGLVTYSKTTDTDGNYLVSSGSYLVIFDFYSQDAETSNYSLLGSYREYASVINEAVSKSECTIDEIGSLYSITYKLNGGAFASGITAPGSYTLHSGTISLPIYKKDTSEIAVARTGFIFGGWYDNPECSGSPITEIPSGSTGNKTFYAKWYTEVNVKFNANADNAYFSENHVTFYIQKSIKNFPDNLLTVAELGLVNDGKNAFLGWSTSSTPAAENPVEYKDGAQITATGDMNLYAVWSAGAISGDSSNTEKDTDGDGIPDYLEFKYHTDPSSADTDGDGWTDKQEVEMMISAGSFNPLNADTPRIGVKMTKKPSISYVYTISKNDSRTVSSSHNEGSVGSQSSTASDTKTHTLTSSKSYEIGISAQYGTQSFVNGSFKHSNTSSTAEGDSYTYAQSASEGWSKGWSNGESATKVEGKSISGGKISIDVRFTNPSDIAYTVESVTVSLCRIANDMVAGNTYGGNKDHLKDFIYEKRFTIAPHSVSGDISLSADLTVAQTEKLEKFSNGFSVDISAYKITMQRTGQAQATDFTEALTEVRAKTAAVYFDYGPNSNIPSHTYNVAVKNQYNCNATSLDELYTKNTLKYVFDQILKLKEGTDYTLYNSGALKSLKGLENQLDAKKGVWLISHTKHNGDNKDITVYNPSAPDSQYRPILENIKLSACDEVYILYTEDKDGDGVSLNDELINGTSDEKKDTDGDGLTDYEEIYGWYKDGQGLASKYSSTNKITTNPRIIDTDGDGLKDYALKDDGTYYCEDSDPLVSAGTKNTSLSLVQYAKAEKGTFKTVEYSAHGSPLITDCIESIWLNAEAVDPFAKLYYLINEDPETADESHWRNIDPNEEIKLLADLNNIYIRCKASNGTDKEDYRLSVRAPFQAMTNFTTKSPEVGGGRVDISWDQYIDKRAKASEYGGYILYLRKGNHSDFTLERSEVGAAKDTITDWTKDDVIFYKLSEATLAGGTFSVNLARNIDYTICIFAYTGSNIGGSFRYSVLGKATQHTGVCQTGKLVLYPRCLRNKTSRDNGNPSYFWSFSSDLWDLSGLSRWGRDSKLEFDEENKRVYNFSTGQLQPDIPPQLYKNGFTKEIYRASNQRFDFSCLVEEYDAGANPDDFIGMPRILFEYNKATDTWTLANIGSGHFPKTTITTGQKSENLVITMDTSDGDVQLYFDVEWKD